MIKHLVSAGQLTPAYIKELFAVADEMERLRFEKGRIDLLADKVICLLFLEPSSRTMLSFQSAAVRLGAAPIFVSGRESTSFAKGETLQDTIRVAANYADLLVMRHAQAGSAAIAAEICPVPFINAGDGSGEHPTQALVDAYTILKNVGRLNDLKILIGFDPKQSRALHSLVSLMSQYKGNRFTFVCPPELAPEADMLNSIEAAGGTHETFNLLPDELDYDVVYVNRLQQERFADPQVFAKYRPMFALQAHMVMRSRAIILDPLPRVDEIHADVDALPNALYFKQAGNGVPVRMALLATLLGRNLS